MNLVKEVKTGDIYIMPNTTIINSTVRCCLLNSCYETDNWEIKYAYRVFYLEELENYELPVIFANSFQELEELPIEKLMTTRELLPVKINYQGLIYEIIEFDYSQLETVKFRMKTTEYRDVAAGWEFPRFQNFEVKRRGEAFLV